MTEGTEFEGVAHDDVTSEFAPAVIPESPEPQPEQLAAPVPVTEEDVEPEVGEFAEAAEPATAAVVAAEPAVEAAELEPEHEAAPEPAEPIEDSGPAELEPAESEGSDTAIAEPEAAEPAIADEPEPAAGDPGQTDDLTAAIREANENLEAEPSLDDIAPGTVIADTTTSTDADLVAEGVDNAPWWPFLIYLALWIGFGVAMVMQFSEIPDGQAIYDAPLYPMSIIAGLALMALGLLWILVVWLVTMRRPGSSKGSLFFSALLKGSLSIVMGVIIWWAALVVLDTLRLGSPL